MSKTRTLTAARLRELLNYNPETGVFTRRVPTNNGRQAGSIAGCLDNGYIRIEIDDVSHWAHRLAWLYLSGAHPLKHIDHINGDGTNNRIINLRCATRSENLQNQRKPHKNNKSGFLGVWIFRKKWRACIKANNKTISLGTFDTPQGAYDAYRSGKCKYHPTSLPLPEQEVV